MAYLLLLAPRQLPHPPPIKPSTITTTEFPSAPFSFSPPSPSSYHTSYLWELGGNQSLVEAYMLFQPTSLVNQGTSFLTPGEQDGFERRGISCGEARNSKWRRLELWWPLSFSDKLSATPWGAFPTPCPSSLYPLWCGLHHRHIILLFFMRRGALCHHCRRLQWEVLDSPCGFLSLLSLWGGNVAVGSRLDQRRGQDKRAGLQYV